MKKFLLLILVLIIPLTCLFSQRIPDSLSYSEGRLNGRGWDGFTKDEKAIFIMGISNGSELLRGWLELKISDEDKIILTEIYNNLFSFENFTNGEIVEIIDTFYSDKANILIPVSWSLNYAVLKLKGVSENELEKIILEFRNEWNNGEFSRRLRESKKKDK